MSNSLDPDQAEHFVLAKQNIGPNLGPNCLQRQMALVGKVFNLYSAYSKYMGIFASKPVFRFATK